MRYLDEYRDSQVANRLLARIRALAKRKYTLMEVCGGQTHGLIRYGIDEQLADVVEMIHGPGCPVCVTPAEDIDLAISISRQPGVVVATFGDMLRVPGTRGSLASAHATGAQTQVIYSPLDAVQWAVRWPERQVVLLAVGFETTAPATALAILQAEQLGLSNFSVVVSHVRVLPAMERIMSDPGCRVEGFLAAGHVCAVDGFQDYVHFTRRHHVPVVVTGFEPVDLLSGIAHCIDSVETGRHEVRNEYGRSARMAGNRFAQNAVAQAYEIADRPWRGLGTVAAGGLALRQAYRHFDARSRFAVAVEPAAVTEVDASSEYCAEVLMGKRKPPACPWFGTRCTPDVPIGAPMVSSEGACAAYHARRQLQNARPD